MSRKSLSCRLRVGLTRAMFLFSLLLAGSGLSPLRSQPPGSATAEPPATVPPVKPLEPVVRTGVAPAKTPGGMTSLAPNMLTADEALASIRLERDAYFMNARREVYRSTLEVLAQHESELNHDIKYMKLIRGDPKRREIALTFDDGPHAGYTDQILTILKKYNVPATFFVVGIQAEKFPNLLKEEVKAGHLIANHTYHHVSLPKIPQEYVADEILACGKVIQAITGTMPHYFRPPGGEYNKEVAEASEALGYTMVLWTDDPGDYASPGTNVILRRTLLTAHPGGIILLHDGIAQTVTILPQLISTLKAQGYTFVRVDKLHRPKSPSVAPDILDHLKIAARL